MGRLSDWFKILLAKLNIHSDDALSQKESEYTDSGGIAQEEYLLSELGVYIHSIIETLSNENMGNVFTNLGYKVAGDFAARPHLREVYLLADDPLKVPINKARRTTAPSKQPVKRMSQAEESFAIARLKKLVTMPMEMGRQDEIFANLEDIKLGPTKQDREGLLTTPSTRMLLEIGMARIWLYHMCEAAVVSKKSNELMVYVEGVACLSIQQLNILTKSDFVSTKMADVSKMPGLRDRRRMLAGDLLNTHISLAALVPVYYDLDIDYPGESDHKIFPITTNPILRPSSRIPCYGVLTSDYDILIHLITNMPRLIFTDDCHQCGPCKQGDKCRFKNTIAREIIVHMKTSYAFYKKNKDGVMVEAEEPRRVFKVVALYRAIYKALRTKKEYKWMLYPFNTIIFLALLCASNTDYCDGLPEIGPATIFDELCRISKEPKLAAKYKDMVVVDPLTYIAAPTNIVTPTIDLEKVRSFILGIYTRKHATLLAESSDIKPDPLTNQYTLDQIFYADTRSRKKIRSINEKHFTIVLNNAIWNFKYIFNGFVHATAYRSNCIELDSKGEPKYGWKNNAPDSEFGAGHHINSALITNDF